MPKVLIVDDDPAIVYMLEDVLQRDHLTCFASDGVGALHQLAVEQPDLVLLDLRMPDMDGAVLLSRIRTLSTVPIIVVSARAEQSDRVPALRAGADDFLAKPFDIDDLLARIEAVLRRSKRVPFKRDGLPDICVGPLVISHVHGTVTVGSSRVHLTPIETRILSALADHPGESVTLATLSVAGWGMEDRTLAHTIRCHVKHLRKKVSGSGLHIDTRHRAGYVLVLDP